MLSLVGPPKFLWSILQDILAGEAMVQVNGWSAGQTNAGFSDDMVNAAKFNINAQIPKYVPQGNTEQDIEKAIQQAYDAGARDIFFYYTGHGGKTADNKSYMDFRGNVTKPDEIAAMFKNGNTHPVLKINDKPYPPCTTPPTTTPPKLPPPTTTPPTTTPPTTVKLAMPIGMSAQSVGDGTGCRSTVIVSYSANLTGDDTLVVISVVLKVNGTVWADSGALSTQNYHNAVERGNLVCGTTYTAEVSVTVSDGTVRIANASITTPVP
ncbi:MAG: hypothetical protein V1767_05560 [Chloroflexota bacterium]